MSEKAITPLMQRVLDSMSVGRAMTPNEIGYAIGLQQGDVMGGGSGVGRGSGHRAFGPAQRIIPVLTALRKRGLIGMVPREDGLSGTAYFRRRPA